MLKKQKNQNHCGKTEALIELHIELFYVMIYPKTRPSLKIKNKIGTRIVNGLLNIIPFVFYTL